MKNENSKDILRVVMLEHIGESGGWEWYAIERDTTPEKAIKAYYKENSTLDDLKEDGSKYEKPHLVEWGSDNEWYGFDEEVRAYYIII